MKALGNKLRLDFAVKAIRDGEIWEGPFADLLFGPTIVSVYMKNNTPTCDAQVASLARGYEKLRRLGYSVVVVSKDSCGSHKRYASKQGASFAFVSDPDYAFANAVDSVVEKKMYGRVFHGPTRSAYLLSQSGVLLGAIEKVDASDHVEQLADLIAESNRD